MRVARTRNMSKILPHPLFRNVAAMLKLGLGKIIAKPFSFAFTVLTLDVPSLIDLLL